MGMISTPFTGLLDLPNEVLLLILNNRRLSADDHYSLGIQCRRLNSLSMPIFLSYHGISNPTHAIHIHSVSGPGFSDLDPVSGLQVAFYLTMTERLTCDFRSLGAAANSSIIFPGKINRLIRLIARLTQVEEINLILDRDIYQSSRNSIVKRAIGDEELRNWVETVQEILNLSLSKGCSSLTVSQGASLANSYQLQDSGLLSKPVERVYQWYKNKTHKADPLALNGPGWEFRRRGEYQHVMTLAPSQVQYNLRTLSIQSRMLVHPPCYSWTISLLRSCPSITALSLSHISIKDPRVWSTILGAIADAVFKQLTTLSIGKSCPWLQIEDILRFLCRFQLLDNLSIFPTSSEVDYILGNPLPNRYPRPSFPRLRSLLAPLSYIMHIMKSSTAPPCMTSLRLFPEDRLSSMLDCKRVSAAVNDLLVVIKLPKTVTCSLYLNDSLFTFFHYNMKTTIQELTSSERDVVFHHITEVCFETFNFHPNNVWWLCMWLNLLFPDLEQFVIERLHDNASECRPLQGQAFTSATLVITDRFRERCPQVRRIIIGQQLFPMRDDSDGLTVERV